jgi:uncharacterized protein (DUF305 family)
VHTKTAIGMLAAALTTALIAGCSTPNTPNTPASTTGAPTANTAAPSGTAAHNDADVAFAQNMVPHHRQAVDMADTAAGHSQNPQVRDLAAKISAAQAPEIQTITGWLQQWGAEVPSDMGMTGGDHTGMAGMTGMMSPEQMQQLGQANGPMFDRTFLQMMIDHHTGAITMAQTELRDGQNPDAKALAQKIIDAQQAEITTMKQLLTTS